jgi:hypothetical protein
MAREPLPKKPARENQRGKNKGGKTRAEKQGRENKGGKTRAGKQANVPLVGISTGLCTGQGRLWAAQKLDDGAVTGSFA